MNDLYVSDGKQDREVDLGLPTTEKLNVEWPTPRQIAATSKRDAYSLTFRIDEVAYTCLDLLSQQCDMTMNSFVNALFNSYIEQNRSTIDGLVFNRALNIYMERLQAKLLRLSNLEILKEYHLPVIKDVLRFNKMELPDDKTSQDTLFENFYQDMLRTGNDRLTNFLFSSPDLHLRLVPDDQEAQVDDMRNCTPNEQNSVGFADYSLTIPCSKWVIVSTILDQYSQKVRQLFKHKNFLGERDLPEIAKIINQYDGKELIKNLTTSLELPEKLTDITI